MNIIRMFRFAIIRIGPTNFFHNFRVQNTFTFSRQFIVLTYIVLQVYKFTQLYNIFSSPNVCFLIFIRVLQGIVGILADSTNSPSHAGHIEAMIFQGWPIAGMVMPAWVRDGLLQSSAGNAVSPPVLLGLEMAALTSIT